MMFLLLSDLGCWAIVAGAWRAGRRWSSQEKRNGGGVGVGGGGQGEGRVGGGSQETGSR